MLATLDAACCSVTDVGEGDVDVVSVAEPDGEDEAVPVPVPEGDADTDAEAEDDDCVGAVVRVVLPALLTVSWLLNGCSRNTIAAAAATATAATTDQISGAREGGLTGCR